MEPKYQVGDCVCIKKSYDPGKNAIDYPYSFLPEMLRDYGGKIIKIVNIKMDYYNQYYIYRLENNNFYWTEDMFDPITDEL